jgi:hypothetical protein
MLSELNEIPLNEIPLNEIPFNNNEVIDNETDGLFGYFNSEVYYNECTIKDLLRICEYYDIDKLVKTAKCKKQDIIETIIYFENDMGNYDVIKKRNKMWKYIHVLKNDKTMKKYVIWN